MLKSIKRLLLVAALLVPWVTQAQITTFPYSNGFESGLDGWTVTDADNDGYTWLVHTQSYYGSANGGSAYLVSESYGELDGSYEVLYPDNWLISPAITIPSGENYDLSWWVKTASGSYPSENYSVYVGTTGTAAALGGTTPVYTHTMLATEDVWAQITVSLASYAGQTVYIGFRHHNCSDQLALLIDDIFIGEAPSCMPVRDLTVAYVTSDSVILSWSYGGSESEWVVSNGVDVVSVYDTFCVFDQLSANTIYNFAVSAVCSPGDTSLVSTVSARTACGDITALPFTEDFNSYASNSFPSCWNRVMGSSGSSYPYVTSSYGNSMMFAGTAAVIAPLIPLLPGQMVVSFDLRKEGSSSGSMNFGFVTDPTDISTMVVLQNIDPSTTATYFHYEIDLSLFPDIDTITSPVYITWRQNSTSTIWYYWLDNILIEQANDCAKPQNLTVNSAAADSVVVSWNEVGTASDWQVVFGPVGFLPDTVADNVAIVNPDTTAVISTLVSGQTYQVYVRSDCGDGYSNWQGPVTFTPGSINMGLSGSATMTLCGAVVYDNGGVNGNYESSSDYTLTLYPNDDTKRFKFWGNGSTESCCDYLRIYAGASASGTMLAQIQGENIVVDTVSTQGGPITLYFHSDGSVVNSGFAIYLACEDLPECRDIQSIDVVATTTSSAFVTWEMAVGTTPLPSSFIVTVTDSNDNVVNTYTATDTYIAIGDMLPNSEYTVSVVPSCDGSDGAAVYASLTTADFGCAEVDSASLFFDTIVNGSSTSSYIPSYSTYNYSLTQQIFTAAEIGHSGGISSIYFMPSAYSVPRSLEIYMGHCQQSTASSFLNPADLTMVYSGSSVSLTAGQWNEFPLTTTFNYNGNDNLIIIVRDMTGSWTSGNTWMGADGTTGVSRYIYQDSGPYSIGTSDGTASSFRSNIILAGAACNVQATCANPWATIVSVDSSSVTLTWIPGASETSWNVEYRLDGDVTWTPAATGVTSTSYTITGLNPSSDYEARVVSNCTEDVYAATVAFTTECGAAVLPLTEDFQVTGQFARNCWLVGTTNLGTSYPYPTVVHLQGDDQNGLCLFYNGAYMVLPKVAAPLNQLQARFTFIQGGDDVRFLMGLLPNQSEPINNIIVLDTIIRSEIDTTSATISYTYSFANIDPQYNGYNLAFWDAFNDNYSFIDNFVLEYIPSCAPVTGLAANNVTATSADISWTSDNSTASFVVEYGPHNFALGTGTRVAAATTGISLTGLAHSSNYDLYVYTVCNNGADTSIASALLQFSTQCDVVSTLPYSVDFENIMPNGSSATNILPNCWASVATSGTQPHTVWSSSATYYQSPTHSLYFNDNGVVALPAFAAPLNTLAVSFFDYNPNGDGLIVGVVDNADAGFEATFVPVDTIAYNDGNNGAYQITSYLTAYTGTSTHIAFKNYSTSGSSASEHYIDDVVVDLAPSCTPVSNLRVTGSTTNSVTLDWGSYNTTDDNWIVSYSTTMLADPMLGTADVVTAHPYTITGLTPGTDYYFYVRNDCGAGDSSDWRMVGPVRPGVWIMRPNQTDTVYMCGGTIYDDGGATGSYSASQTSTIIIKPDSPNNLVSVSGTSYTESSYDYVSIYDGIGTGGTELWSDYGVSSNQTFGPIESSSGALTIYFHSDGSVQYSGFEINVSCVSTNCRVMNLSLDPSVSESDSYLALMWDPVTDAQSYQIEYGTAGFQLGQGQVMNSNTNSVVINGLTATTNYDVYVRSICSGDDTGSWTRGTYQTAMCDSPVIAYSYDTNMTSTTTSYAPIGYSLYEYSYVQTLIAAERLTDITGDITAFAFNVTDDDGSDQFENITVWMANVSDSNLADGAIIPDADHVFVKVVDSANFNFTGTGWMIHSLDSAFTWDGQSNILIAVKRDNGDWSGTAEFAAHNTSDVMTYYYYQDTYDIDPMNPDASYDNPLNLVADIKLISCGVGCAKPSLLPVTNLSYDGATLNWNSNATDFEVSVKAVTDGVWPDAVAVSNATSYIVTGLNAATQYQYRVRAICDATENLISDWTIGTFTTDSLPCFDPTDLHTTNVGYTSATLAWNADATQNHWTLTVWNTADTVDYDVTGNAAYTVTGLTQDNQYYAAVKAICGNGAAESEYSDTIQFTTNNCEQVTGVTVTNITDNSAVVSWQAATATSYEVDYGPVGHGQGQGTTVIVNNVTTYTITGLESETSYSVYVHALCEADAPGPWSQVQEFTTGIIGIDVADGMNVSIYPNPTSSTTTIALSGVNGDVAITVVDMNGRVVMSDSMSCEGDCVKTMEVSGLAQGAYFVRINGENVNMVKKLVVK